MAYTHVQCIGYQVPTVAKKFLNVDPGGGIITMPNIQDSSGNDILPSQASVRNNNNTTNIGLYT
ncbi:MAG: hypothetical protein AAF934_04585, partial [Bacteroidota bacterium]